MYIGFVIIVPERGVYLGAPGSWSKINTLGQDHAVTFPAPSTAMDHMLSGPGGVPPNARIKLVRTVREGYASIAECEAVGVESWTP